jgi:outer membrane protein OmpA-like peptidoglycan-associated protein
MGDSPQAKLLAITDGGLSAKFASAQTGPTLVAPATEDQHNTLRLLLRPIACWRIEDPRFSFDSSFIVPDATEEFTALASLSQSLPDAPLSVFGHADPVGQDDYNKRLSGRRAEAVYGVLTRNTGMWENLYSNPQGRDDWGVRVIQTILQALGFDPGPIDGIKGDLTTAAIQNFQSAQGIDSDGIAGPNTRKHLFQAYMDFLAKDESGTPFSVTPGAFLGGGADAQGRVDYQGCGEFNPVLMFSADENAAFQPESQHAVRNQANTANRRVLVYLFRPGTRIDPGKWPCPASAAGPSGCHKRFWSDAQTRRQFQDERREFAKTRDTFACRFYQFLVSASPCERFNGKVRVHIRVVDHVGFPAAGQKFSISIADAGRDATADNDGVLDAVMPEGDISVAGLGGNSVFFGEGYDFYQHDAVSEFDDVAPFPFREEPGSKDGRANGYDIEELSDVLASIFGIHDEEA